jgi:gamma-glutamylaminecyclotransferase
MKHGNIFNESEVKVAAVYGTLRQGYSNHIVIDDSEYIGTGKTKELYTLTAYCNGFPALDKSVPTHNVVMELYQLLNEKTANRMDSLEGYGSGFYDRSIVDVELEDGSVVQAWTYDIEGCSESCPTVPNGDWSHHRPTMRERFYG